MKLIIKKSILLEALLNTSKAISQKNLIPILTGIKFDLKKEGLYLYASDSDISIRSFIDKDEIVKIEETGSVVIGGKYIVEIVKKLPESNIVIEVLDGYNMIISASDGEDLNNKIEFNLNGINPSEFPNLDLEESKNPIVIDPITFKTIINQTSFATSLSETRPILTGINFKLEGKSLQVIATDSYRLAKKVIELNDSYDNSFDIVIPGKNLLELSRIIEDDKENIQLHIFSNKILFKYKNILFLSRLISGTYPVSSDIIPTEFSINVNISYSNLFNMIDRASLLTSDKDKNIIRLDLNDKELIISSNSPEIGKVENKISVINDGSISISFSSKYMLDAIRSFYTDNIIICMNNDNSPIIIKGEGDTSLIQLVLPIKTY